MADQPQDFLTFDQALDQLRLREEELKRLVSEGEIRAFREGETMRLRKGDVESLRRELGGEAVDIGEATEELIFEDDADLHEAGMATEELAEVETLLDEEVKDVGEVELEEEALEEADAEEDEAVLQRRTAAAEEEGLPEGAGILVAAIATSAILILALPVVVAKSMGVSGGLARGLADKLGSMFGG